MKINATWVIILFAILNLAAVAFIAFGAQQQINSYLTQVQTLSDRANRLSYNTASGGGINLKMMPDPITDQPTVPMEEVFSFDRNHAMCRVETNPQAFKMPTFKLGEVVLEPHSFFMYMTATSIDQFNVETQSDGKRKVTMRGGLSCATEAAQGKVKFGSRTAAEHATYIIEALDGGIGGGDAGDSFAFTAFFDPDLAPVNYSIFGPKATFTGKMVQGEITITDPSK